MKWSRALYVVLILVVLVFFYGLFVVRSDSAEVVDISRVAELANNGEIESITVDQDQLTVTLDDDTQVTAYKEPDVGITETLKTMGVSDDQVASITITVAPRSAWEGWLTILGTLLPLILILMLRLANDSSIMRGWRNTRASNVLAVVLTVLVSLATLALILEGIRG